MKKAHHTSTPRQNFKKALFAAIAALILEDEMLNTLSARIKLAQIDNSPQRGPHRVNIVRNRTNISFQESTAVYSDKEFERAFRMNR